MYRLYETRVETSPNGLTVCAVSFPGVKTVNLYCCVFVGSAYESASNNGISHFLEHMLFRGNEKMGSARSLNLKMEELGGELNAATSFDLTEYWFDCHVAHLEKGITRFCQFLKYPVFTRIEVERSIIVEEIKSDYNESNHLIDLDSLTARKIFSGHSMEMPIIGTLDTVNAISTQDLLSWFKSYYQPGNMVVGISGDIEIEQVISAVHAQFETSKKSHRREYPPFQDSTSADSQLELVYDSDNQFNLRWSFPTFPLSCESRICYQLIQRILDDGGSGLLQRSIREERGLVYDISAEMDFFREGTILSIQSTVGISRLHELIYHLARIVETLISQGVSREELELAKKRYKISLDCDGDTTYGALAGALSPLISPYATSGEETIATINRVNLEKINQALTRLLRQNQSCFALVGPWTEKTRLYIQEKLYPWINGKNSS